MRWSPRKFVVRTFFVWADEDQEKWGYTPEAFAELKAKAIDALKRIADSTRGHFSEAQ